jgi:hypothetical protein
MILPSFLTRMPTAQHKTVQSSLRSFVTQIFLDPELVYQSSTISNTTIGHGRRGTISSFLHQSQNPHSEKSFVAGIEAVSLSFSIQLVPQPRVWRGEQVRYAGAPATRQARYTTIRAVPAEQQQQEGQYTHGPSELSVGRRLGTTGGAVRRR